MNNVDHQGAEALKPCPFCNSIVIVREAAHMTCIRCGADGPDADEASNEAARAAWNRRPAPAAGGDGLPELRWLPIEQAPKDGSQLLLTNGAEVAQGWWEVRSPRIEVRRDMEGRYLDQFEDDGFEGWIDFMGGMQPEPTHYMPLPAAPGSKEGGAA